MNQVALVQGRAYYRLTFADPGMTIPGVEPMKYVGQIDLDDAGPLEPKPHAFQDTVTYSWHGDVTKVVIPLDTDPPCLTWLVPAEEIGTAVLDLPHVVEELRAAVDRAAVAEQS